MKTRASISNLEKHDRIYEFDSESKLVYCDDLMKWKEDRFNHQ